MINSLAKKLADAKGGPIDHDGKSILMSFKKSIITGQEVEVDIFQFNERYQQGFEISIDQRKGFVEVNSQKLVSPIFWTSTAPKSFSFKCFTKKTEGILNIWNVWKNTEFNDSVDAWIGNAGLYVEQIEATEYIIYCSNGLDDVNFHDLVFKIKIK